MVSNSTLFCLATVLATFQKIGQFFPNHLVTLLPTQEENASTERFAINNQLKGKAQYS